MPSALEEALDDMLLIRQAAWAHAHGAMDFHSFIMMVFPPWSIAVAEHACCMLCMVVRAAPLGHVLNPSSCACMLVCIQQMCMSSAQ